MNRAEFIRLRRAQEGIDIGMRPSTQSEKRVELERQVAEFIARGGKITQLPSGEYDQRAAWRTQRERAKAEYLARAAKEKVS
ncbi:hypothetical protein [Porticoccus sp.]